MALNPNVVVVAPGDLITAAHINNIRANLVNFDTDKLGIVGNWAMAGSLGVNGPGGVTVTGSSGVTSSTGRVRVGDDPAGTNSGVDINPGGAIISRQTTASTAGSVALTRAGDAAANGQRFASFIHSANGIIGSILIASSTSVQYATTSDPRLKERTGDAADAAEVVQALGRLAYRGRWKADPGGSEWVFLNSTDVEAVAPFAVSGEADAVLPADDPYNPGGIDPQQLDHGALVPLLFAALSQALDRIAALEAR